MFEGWERRVLGEDRSGNKVNKGSDSKGVTRGE